MSRQNYKEEHPFFCSITFSENLAVYDIMLKNIIDSGRPQVTI